MQTITLLNILRLISFTNGLVKREKSFFQEKNNANFVQNNLNELSKNSEEETLIDNEVSMKAMNRPQQEDVGGILKETTYVGAVLEYEPYDEWTEEGKGYQVLRKNAQEISKFVVQAKSEYEADIMVVPEYAITSLNLFPDNLNKFLTYTLYVPEPSTKFVPCAASDKHFYHFEALRMLSCAAIQNELYLVINVAEVLPCSEMTILKAPWRIMPSKNCPKSGYFFYNTEVVLDRNGTVVARYRKVHLHMEDFFTPGPMEDKYALFLTDFNVLFTLQTCFDLVYEHPGYNNVRYLGVKDIIMSTAWIDYLPFETANEAQNGFSRGLKANLLVSGYHKPEKGKMGSGIYKGYSGHLPEYTFDKNSGNVLIVSNITTLKATQVLPMLLQPQPSPQRIEHQSHKIVQQVIPQNSTYEPKEIGRKHFIMYENLKNYTKVLLKGGEKGEVLNATICSNDDFCCSINYQYSGDLIYYFVIYSGKFIIDNRYIFGKQVCGILWCPTLDHNTCAHIEYGLPDTDSFGPFKIASSSFKTDSITLIGLHRDLFLIRGDKIAFESRNRSASLSIAEGVNDLLVSALYGRWYCQDNLI